MDDYLATPQIHGGAREPDKMAPGSPGSSGGNGSSRGSPGGDTLSQMSADLTAISANMLTRSDKAAMVAELRAAIREEVMAVRRDLAVLEQRVDSLEEDRLQTSHRLQSADLAASRQGIIILDLRRQVEDLDNRGRRNNIRVGGMPESEGESPRELLTGLFHHILGDEAPMEFGFERAHRALRAPRRDGLPRDLICCLQSFPLKEAIMRAARSQRVIQYGDAQISLYHDLSSLTLDARRALKPITSLLQEKRIPYKWGFPFSLQAKVDNQWHILRWPNEVPRFLQAAGLPHVVVPNWILECPPAPDVPAETLSAATSLGPRRRGPGGPEE
ncbi:Hypothetical predicted protein [Pelobates cultripes]|uniref:Uncharacterized protein n=1 Tax=Pelobates cultripes TaxID=61616 RepID=A0AAD1SR79_PELCU|nr:Hypothetical predicted protein [Pelobates cultripes]